MITDLQLKKKKILALIHQPVCERKRTFDHKEALKRPSRNYIKVSQKKECAVGACAVNYGLSEYMK